MKKTILVAASLMTGIFSFAQITTDIALPDEVRQGKLENGMTYFIMHNEEPKDRVSFYFAQNVGAILEEDDEDGLAHFLEHMAFNGSENFEGRSMDMYLESKGLLFGRDFNAYTSLDETLYNIDNVPVKDEELIDKCLLIMHDWSGSLLLEGKDIDDERGVIAEEWRNSRNAEMRIFEKLMPVIYKGSRYAERDVIGSLDFIRSFEHESLRNYYQKWYRPDLQAVVIVGDIDVDEMETKVKNLFSKIPMPADAKERPFFDIPDNEGTLYMLATDKGATDTDITWYFKEDNTRVKNEAYLKERLVSDLFTAMIGNRYEEKIQDPTSAATSMEVGNYALSLYKGANYITVIPKAGQEIEALEEAYTEIARIKNNGFLESELERQKQNLSTVYENAVREEKKIDNAEWANALSQYYFNSEPFTRAKWDMEFLNKTLPTISLADVNAFANKFDSAENSVITVSGSDNKKMKYPTKEEILAVTAKIKGSQLENYADDINDAPLIAAELAVQPIKEIFAIDNIAEAKGYILNNGVKVVLFPSKKEGDNVTMVGTSYGGLSKVKLEDLPSGRLSADLSDISGVADFSSVQLTKKLTGRTAEVGTSITSYTEDIAGSSNVKDMELLLQLTYLYFENPRFDKAIFEAQLPVQKQRLQLAKSNEQNAFYDSVSVATVNRHPRRLPMRPETLDQVDFEKSKAIYKERFSDADDFVYVFIGNFDFDTALPLIQKYLGNLKSVPTKEEWTDHKVRPKDGTFSTIFDREMTSNPQTSIYYEMTGKIEHSLQNDLIMQVISAVLDTRYVDTIREEEGGSYGVGVYSSLGRIPEERFNLIVQFNCNPDKRERLLEIVKEEIANIKDNGPLAAYVEKAKENLLKDRAEDVNDDDFWQSELFDKLLYNEDYVGVDAYKKAVKAITPQLVQEFAKKHFPEADVVEVVMNPKM